ncbi:hypothetical protein DFH08DRAFT_957837 [Mycena albidolilacea]|uniref:CxC1-like cysteine cluster associated with KDZ transposases domain-containing protein n=1 Tax=Mycena albidolilacea TaxID=1033008 RepID=A0AAD7ETV2_9AGAR|nr:hypothetical protein DFH08DRAFT_957837 [Mycena albidolilacea]
MPSARASGGARNMVSSMSSRLHINTNDRQSGRRHICTLLTAAKIREAKVADAHREAERREAMTREECRELKNLRDLPDAFGDDDDGWEEDLLHGRAVADISHAGEALQEDSERADADLFEGLRESSRQLWRRRRFPDLRRRRDRTQLQVDGFARQLDQMADVYVELGVAVMEGGGLAATYNIAADAEIQESRDITVIDVFSNSHQPLQLIRGDAYIASACVCRGWMPASTWNPTVIITIRALEVYRIAHLRCPWLGIQAFIRSLCDIHGIAPRPWLGAQFSAAFDAYLAICAEVDRCVQVALGCDTLHWRLKNACPCCLYKVEGEPVLKIPLMGTFDGNNSRSRFERCERLENNEEGTCAPGALKERLDDRVVPGDLYLPREDVDVWKKDGVEELMKSFSVDDEEEAGGCGEGWQNMKEGVTSRAYGMYDETGFFPALCRHGFILKVVDMVKSGELSKYPLSLTHHLLNVLGQVALGYDIGCKFGKLVFAHPALKDLARNKDFRALVGAFHGHDHKRLCGIENLMMYVEGIGLEALEGCESLFSKSNALASTTRYSSRFHCQQAIVTYLKHTDAFDTYHGLTTYAALRETMRELGVESRAEFEQWRAKEKAHLLTLSKEQLQESLEMEYLQKLINLQDAEKRITALRGVDLHVIPQPGTASYTEAAKATRRLETQLRHAHELQMKILAAMQDLEVRLEVVTWWLLEDEKWSEVSEMVQRRRYQRALDHLQGLIISRMFELAKCNMSGTGYQLQKHITKALQARSKAVKNAISNYNDVAQTMTPPRPTLTWEEVVEYAFLADFDLLCEGREDIRGEPWAQPAGRAAMDQHYKLLRVDEEIQHLNVEIRRLVTYMGDEARFLAIEEGRLREEGEEGLALQVQLLHMERARFTDVHMEQLTKLSKEPISNEDVKMRAPSPPPQQEGLADGEEELESDDDDGELAEAFLTVVRITHDNTIETGDS